MDGLRFTVWQKVSRHQKLVEEFEQGPEGCGAHLMQISSGQGLVGIFVVQTEPVQTVDNFFLPVFVTNGPIVFVLSTHSVNGTPFARTASSFHHRIGWRMHRTSIIPGGGILMNIT